MRKLTGPSRWLSRALFTSALTVALVCVAESSAQPPANKSAASVPNSQKLAGGDGDRFAPKLSKSEQQIEAALARPVTCKYRDTPLAEVVADLAKQADLPIEFDDEGLKTAEMDRTSPITFAGGPLSLRGVLTMLQVRHRLDYMPALGGLRLTSAEIAAEERNQVLRVYPIGDLIKDAADPVRVYGGYMFDSDYDSLIDLISDHVDADSWTDNGGTGGISGYFGSLVVRQTLARHHRVASILAGLREFPLKSATVVNTAAGPTHDALAKPLAGEAQGSLNDFLTQVNGALKIPLVVDAEGLKGIDVQTATPVRGAFREQSGYEVLSGILRPLQCSVVVFPEFVLVTAEGNEPSPPDTRLYSVAGLVDADELEPAPRSFGFGSFDTVIDLITSTVEPDAWTDNGGPSRIIGLLHPACVAVTAPHGIHLQIEPMLESLRQTRKDELARNRQPGDKIVERVYSLYTTRRQLKAQLEKRSPETPAKPAGEDKDTGSHFARPTPSALAQFGGGGMGGFMGAYGSGQVADPIPTADDVAVLIRELLPDPSWKEAGVLLRPFHDVLIVRQRRSMLRKIEKLLADIDAWHDPMSRGLGGHVIPVVGDKR